MRRAIVVLPVPGRAPEDHRRQPVGLDEHPQRRARAEQVLLADDLVEACGAAGRVARQAAPADSPDRFLDAR